MNFDHIDRMSSVAVYAQIENLVQFAIATGELKKGDPLPHSGKLAEELGVSHGTVVKAYKELEGMGVLVARRGKGFIVAEDARKICHDRCYAAIASRIHEVTQEAKAVGMSKALIREAVAKSLASGSHPYGEVPASVMALTKKK